MLADPAAEDEVDAGALEVLGRVHGDGAVKALRMWSWLSIWRMLPCDGCILGKYLSMSSLTCTHTNIMLC